MKKAIEINGKIKIYNRVPNSWQGTKHYVGGFANLSDEELKAEGFYDVVRPSGLDDRVNYLSDIYFDADNEIFTYDIIDRTWELTLSEIKENAINNAKTKANEYLQRTDWYVIRKAERAIDIPQDVIDFRQSILNKLATIEADINSKTTKKNVVLYDIDFEPTEE